MTEPQRNGGPDARIQNATENTPLLGDAIEPAANPGISEVTTLNEPGADDFDKPLPTLQIVLLCFARFVEPLAFFCIFPFINEMVKENGDLDDADVGFYSGLIESLFSLTQMIVMIFWGKAADRIGRKPVLIFSLAGVSVSTAIFGMAKTILQMIIFRCLSGVFAGTVVTIRTMISEHSTSKTQARAFSWFAFAGHMGILVGPLIGGPLADPAHQFPSLFNNVQFFHDYPYALPNIAVGFFCIVVTVVAALFVTETLPKKTPSDGATESSDPAAAKPAQLSTMQLLKSPGVAMVLYLYGHIMLIAFAYTAIIPVFWFTPVELGGYGLPPLHISLLMGVNGLAQALWTLVVFPPLQRRIGTSGVLRVCAVAGPFLYAGSPLFNVLLRLGGEGAERVFWFTLPPALALGCGVCLAFTAVQLALNDVAPNPRILGTLNALALTEVSGIRAVSPALFTSLFAVGVRTQWVWGYFIWVVLAVIALIYTVASRYIPEYDKMREEREQQQRQEGVIE